MQTASSPSTLSDLLEQVGETIEHGFGGELYWIRAELTDVKPYPERRWCFLKLIEKRGGQLVAEARATFWARGYPLIDKFRQVTGNILTSGLELTLGVQVSFHPRYGLNLEVLDIDFAFALGQMELTRRETLQKLATAHTNVIRMRDEVWFTRNNQLPLPKLARRVALLSAPGSDGRRDFLKELEDQPYGYFYHVTDYAVQVQGDSAPASIIEALNQVATTLPAPDIVVLVRGGGSATDLKTFDDYHLAVAIASFPIPIFTGIGHDRNVSVADLMARAFKTPTRVARELVSIREQADIQLQELEERLAAVFTDWTRPYLDDLAEISRQIADLTRDRLVEEHHRLEMLEVKSSALNPQKILDRGFAWVMKDGQLVADTAQLKPGDRIETRMKNHIIVSTIEKIHGLEEKG